jgi:hypothetical protein
MGQWKAEIVTLWVTKVQDFQYCTWEIWLKACPGNCIWSLKLMEAAQNTKL